MPANENMLHKYICVICDYKCSKKFLWDQHLSTTKHISANKMLMPANENMLHKFKCNNCNSDFIHHSSYCRHKKKCLKNNEPINNEIIINKDLSDKDLIVMLIKQNNEMMELLKNGTNNSIACNNNNISSNNKTFNLQLFLNETCKDAMNITDFVKSIQPQLSDLINVGEVGYVEGISNLIISNLKTLDITKRPIHCTDKKREVLYVKDDDKWEKEDGSKMKIRYMIKQVAHKNSGLVSMFREKYPDCNKSHSKYANQYNKLVVESMGGFGDNDTEKEDKIINNIAKMVTVDKYGL